MTSDGRRRRSGGPVSTRGRPAGAFLLALALLAASEAGAPPPVGGFPAALVPADGDSAPPNARLWVFGQGAPAEPAVSMTVGGAVLEPEVARRGCCLVEIDPGDGLAPGEEVFVVVTGEAADVEATFEVAGPADLTAPTLDDVVRLDYSAGTVAVGVEGSDDRLLSGFLGRAGGAVVTAAPEGSVLQAAVGPGGCLAVSALDAAGQESEPVEVCAPPAADAGVVDEGPDPGPGGCACSSAPVLGLALLAPALLGRRRRAWRLR